MGESSKDSTTDMKAAGEDDVGRADVTGENRAPSEGSGARISRSTAGRVTGRTSGATGLLQEQRGNGFDGDSTRKSMAGGTRLG